jgi:cytoskeletal protein RodZ
VRALPARPGHALTFGAYLKQNRVLRELSLEDVTASTRLPQRTLEALEADDVSSLPDRAHALLAARSYASAIGLDPEETALRLEEQWTRSMPPGPPPAGWKRLWRSLPRERAVWIVIAVTLIAIAMVVKMR